MSDPEFPTGIIPRSGPNTPIGRAEFGGRLRGTSGTGFSQFRVYGMYALVFLLSGGGRYRDRRGIDRRLVAGDLLVVFPEHPHQYGPEAGDDWDEVFIAFKGPAFEGWRASGLDPVNPVWNLSEPELWARRFFEILRMPVATLAESTAVAAAIHQLLADALARRPAGREDWLEKACQLLGGGADAPALPRIAAAMGMSQERFRKAFKVAIGEPPSATGPGRADAPALRFEARPDRGVPRILRRLSSIKSIQDGIWRIPRRIPERQDQVVR